MQRKGGRRNSSKTADSSASFVFSFLRVLSDPVYQMYSYLISIHIHWLPGRCFSQVEQGLLCTLSSTTEDNIIHVFYPADQDFAFSSKSAEICCSSFQISNNIVIRIMVLTIQNYVLDC